VLLNKEADKTFSDLCPIMKLVTTINFELVASSAVQTY